MAENNLAGVGLRRRITIAGERYYFIATIDDNMKIKFDCTTPDENREVNINRRITADRTCKVLSEMANAILGR